MSVLLAARQSIAERRILGIARQTKGARGLAAAALLLPAALSAQDPSFRSGVELVEVAVLARDRGGRFVPDLTQADFEIVEAGAPQRLVAFARVAIPIAPPAPEAGREPLVADDVGSNERSGDARVFVLLLDALHVDARRTQRVRRSAREFVERHVGAGDLVAVVSPGGLASATQDFTSDKARLLAAVDQFAGSKLQSAAIGIEQEKRAAERGSAAIHDGRDPDDFERAGRAASLTDTIEALAMHLSRVERRRKSLLLFSEGVDYNQLDALGLQQRYSSDVRRAMGRAVGALMRANVSLYAVDPRGLSSVEGDLGEINTYGVPRGDGSLASSVDQEYGDSIRSLRDVSEVSGGFAAVDTNSFTGAFERILEESSRYYVLGYAPERPMKPGEFRPIEVRVAREGVTVVARRGRVAPAALPRVAQAGAVPEAAPPLPFSAGRSRGRPAELVAPDPAPAVRATKGLASDLQSLLASPLPRAGLPMRVQAIPGAGDAKKGSVQLVVEVLGGGLQFGERGGRFEERVDLAMLTVDAQARAGNGRSTAIELRLTPEELQRVKATGVRWLTRLELAPGRHQVRVAGRASRGAVTGLVTADVLVPRHEPDRPALSGITLTALTAVLMPTKGDPKPGTALDTPPTAARVFVAGDQLTAGVDVSVPASSEDLELVAQVERPDGSRNPPLTRRIAGGQAKPRTEEAAIPIETSSLAPGRYVLRIGLRSRAGAAVEAERPLSFEITTRAGG